MAMRYALLSSALLLLLACGGCAQKPTAGHSSSQTKPVAGNSSACRGCHPAFYKKWATSHHGLAMQPFTPKFAAASLTVQPQAVEIGKNQYQAFFDESSGYIEERGPSGNRKLPLLHIMGGKNVYYFLTPLERARLQVLPLAYDLFGSSIPAARR